MRRITALILVLVAMATAAAFRSRRRPITAPARRRPSSLRAK